MQPERHFRHKDANPLLGDDGELLVPVDIPTLSPADREQLEKALDSWNREKRQLMPWIKLLSIGALPLAIFFSYWSDRYEQEKYRAYSKLVVRAIFRVKHSADTRQFLIELGVKAGEITDPLNAAQLTAFIQKKNAELSSKRKNSTHTSFS